MPPVVKPGADVILHFSLHSDAADGKAAFLVESYRIVILRINPKLQVCTPEGLGKGMDILHHLRSDTLPAMDIEGDEADIGHEATIGRISDEAIFYLMCRGISEDEARAMIVRGFVEPIAKELPLEYAVEMNNLVNIELEGTIG